MLWASDFTQGLILLSPTCLGMLFSENELVFVSGANIFQAAMYWHVKGTARTGVSML